MAGMQIISKKNLLTLGAPIGKCNHRSLLLEKKLDLENRIDTFDKPDSLATLNSTI